MGPAQIEQLIQKDFFTVPSDLLSFMVVSKQTALQFDVNH